MRAKTVQWMVTSALVAAMASPVRLAAQESQEQKQGQTKENDRYILIDMGTLGGPESDLSGPGLQIVNNRGTLVGIADTSNPNPFPDATNPVTGGPHAFIQHAFKWQGGVKTDLGVLQGPNSGNTWISESGLIVGSSDDGVIDPLTGYMGAIAVLWKESQIINLGTLGGTFSLAVAVNNNAQAVGFAQNAIPDPFSMLGLGTQTRAFLWQYGVMQDLGTLGGPDAMAFFVNERGQVVGQAFTNSTPNPATGMPTMEPFLWEDGKMTGLGTLGGTLGVPDAFNNRGQVVGQSDLPGDQTFHPFLWNGGTLKDLGTLGGNYGNATWINDAGSVVGWATLTGDQVHHAFLWMHGAMTDLGTLTNDPCSAAQGINSRGQIIGVSNGCGDPNRPFLWENGGPMVNLNSLIVPGSEINVRNPFFINDRGEIAARGRLPNGDFRAVLLIPCDGNHDGNHPDRQQCEAVAKNAAALFQGSLSLVTQTSSEQIQGRLTPEMLDALRTRSSGRYRGARARPQR